MKRLAAILMIALFVFTGYAFTANAYNKDAGTSKTKQVETKKKKEVKKEVKKKDTKKVTKKGKKKGWLW